MPKEEEEDCVQTINLSDYIFRLYYIDQYGNKFSHEIAGHTIEFSRPFQNNRIMLYYIRYRDAAHNRYSDGWKSSVINNYFGIHHHDYAILRDPNIYV